MYIEMWLINLLIGLFALDTMLKIVETILDYKLRKYRQHDDAINSNTVKREE